MIFLLQDLIYISHSMSRQVLQYIFNVLLPKDLEDKQLLDVGSRLGAVLYGVSSNCFFNISCMEYPFLIDNMFLFRMCKLINFLIMGKCGKG